MGSVVMLLCCYVVSVTVRCAAVTAVVFPSGCVTRVTNISAILVISVRSPNFGTAFHAPHWNDFL